MRKIKFIKFFKNNSKYIITIFVFLLLFVILTVVKGGNDSFISDDVIMSKNNKSENNNKLLSEDASRLIKEVFETVKEEAASNYTISYEKSKDIPRNKKLRKSKKVKDIICLGKAASNKSNSRSRRDKKLSKRKQDIKRNLEKSNSKKSGGGYNKKDDKKNKSGVDIKFPGSPGGAAIPTLNPNNPTFPGKPQPPKPGDDDTDSDTDTDTDNDSDSDDDLELAQIDPNRPNFNRVKLNNSASSVSWSELEPGVDYNIGEIMVKFDKPQYKPDVYYYISKLGNYSLLEVKSISTKENDRKQRKNKLFLVKVNKGANIKEACRGINSYKRVKYARPNFKNEEFDSKTIVEENFNNNDSLNLPANSQGEKWKFTPSGYVWSSIKTADLNKDNKDEIVFISSKNYNENYKKSNLYVLSPKGEVKAGFPKELDIKGWSSPSLVDLDNNKDLEIVVTGEYTAYNNELGKRAYISVFHHNGELMKGWNSKENSYTINGKTFPGQKPASPVVKDIDNDGNPEIIFNYLSLNVDSLPYLTQEMKVFERNGNSKQLIKDKELKLYYSKSYAMQACTPVVGDLDADGGMDIVVGDALDSQGDSYIAAIYDCSGRLEYKIKDPNNAPAIYSRIVASDIYGIDGKKEIIIVRTTKEKDFIYVIDFRDGNAEILSGWPVKSDHPFEFYEPVVANINNNSEKEIIVKGEEKLHIWHYEGSLKSGFPVSDNSGSAKVISAKNNLGELAVSSAIYNQSGNPDYPMNNKSVEMIMDQAFASTDKKPYIKAVLLMVKDGKEYLKSNLLKEAEVGHDSSWPVYKKNPSNTGTDETNSPPNLSSISDQNVNIGGDLSFGPITANDPDPGDSVNITANPVNPNKNPFNHGAKFEDKFFNWSVPNNSNLVGKYLVRFTAFDNRGARDKKTMKITVSKPNNPPPNNPPTFKPIPPQSISIANSSTLFIYLSNYASDPDGDNLSYDFKWKNNKKPSGNFMASILAGTFSLNLLGNNNPETVVAIFRVKDGRGGEDTSSCRITITN